MNVQDRLDPIFPGIPLVENPLFDSLLDAAGFDPETRRVATDLHHKGYAIIDFPDEYLAVIAERLKWKMTKHVRGDLRGHARIQDAWQFNPDVMRIAANPQILRLLSTLYGRPAFPFQTLNFSFGPEQRISSACIHFSAVPDHFMCGVFVALEDLDETSGPLLYYPGSHRLPVLTNEQLGIHVDALSHPHEAYGRFEAAWAAIIEAKALKPERFIVKQGQALILAANLLHGDDVRKDFNRTRWSQLTHYYFEGCAYFTPLLSNPLHGRVCFRTPTDISTGRAHKNIVSGQEVSDAFMQASRQPGPVRERVTDRIRRIFAGHRSEA